ncbi:PWWP domain-containing DNA repair factor 4-like isoform X2 [Onychostoma macrolepis]|uniref:PWWP domain-containing DNA repair factor 4-like isoform X2 n=1 Tax=Onychostoma macrolepis TaxID=369639 RepID=UPI00272CEB5C|nr:PWWP domain-containing DNA repair factor 4-like isoform X2 [Onychostoma macrolepis]
MIFQLCHVRQEGMIVVFLYSCTTSQWCVALGFSSRSWICLSSADGGVFYSWNDFKLMAIYGRRFAFWTEEARSVLEGKTLPLFRVERRTTSNLPTHVQAVQERDRNEKKLVDLILTSKSAEQHLVDILSGKRSKWFPPRFQVPVYIENEQSLTILCNYMKGVLNKTQMQLTYNDEVEFICGCLLPEAIHGLCELQGLSWQEAEEVFLQGPIYQSSEVEEFDTRIARELKNLPNKNLDDL